MNIYTNNLLNELNNIDLYYAGTEATERALEICKSIQQPINKKYNIFAYWIGSNVTYKHSVVLKSFLATQNLNNATLRIYSDEPLHDHPIFKEYKNYKQIQFCVFDVEQEVKNTIYENCNFIQDIKQHKFNSAYESDFFRLLVLYKYGGFYIDFDVLLLRDLSPLLEWDFMYQWGAYPDNANMINGAVMHLKKDSKPNIIASDIIVNSIPSPGPGSLHWASELYFSVKQICPELIIFPAAFFNPEWQFNHIENVMTGVLEQPFKKWRRSDNLFEGSFTWHWHNRWNEQIEEGSKFDILDKQLDCKLQKNLLLYNLNEN